MTNRTDQTGSLKTNPMQRDWLTVGESYTGPGYGPALEQAITALRWQCVGADGKVHGPMSPVLTLKCVIDELALPNVSAYALGRGLSYPDGPETATYQLLGVEANYRNGRLRLYLLDIGVGAVPIATDYEPAPNEGMHRASRSAIIEQRPGRS